MKRRRFLEEDNTLVFNNNSVKITKEKNLELFFEIKNHITTDIAEAVSIMMMFDIKGVWDVEISDNFVNINPEKSLYWLSGGDKEWTLMEHYNTSWINCCQEFCQEYGDIVLDIFKNSKTLGDIKNGFLKYLNLPTLYNFALMKGFIRM